MPDTGQDIIPLETSIVVVGEDCNPSILNPDFLRVQDIVPEDWGWELADAPFTSRGLSLVVYDSDFTIKVEPNRFQVTDAGSSAVDADAKIIQIARRYIEVLPHVRYTAVGNNFQRFLSVEQPLRFLQERFVKPGPWLNEASRDVGISLGYDHDGGLLTLGFENKLLLKQVNDELDRVEGVRIKANFHRDCEGYPTDQSVLAHIARLATDADAFTQKLAYFLSDEVAPA